MYTNTLTEHNKCTKFDNTEEMCYKNNADLSLQ